MKRIWPWALLAIVLAGAGARIATMSGNTDDRVSAAAGHPIDMSLDQVRTACGEPATTRDGNRTMVFPQYGTKVHLTTEGRPFFESIAYQRLWSAAEARAHMPCLAR